MVDPSFSLIEWSLLKTFPAGKSLGLKCLSGICSLPMLRAHTWCFQPLHVSETLRMKECIYLKCDDDLVGLHMCQIHIIVYFLCFKLCPFKIFSNKVVFKRYNHNHNDGGKDSSLPKLTRGLRRVGIKGLSLSPWTDEQLGVWGKDTHTWKCQEHSVMQAISKLLRQQVPKSKWDFRNHKHLATESSHHQCRPYKSLS